MWQRGRAVQLLFVIGTTAVFLGLAVGLYQSIRAERRLPPVELSDVVDTYLQDIELLIEAEEYDRAIAQLELALKLLHRNRHLPHEMLGRTLAMQDRMDEAIDHFRQAIALAPEFAEAHHNLGVAYAARGNVDQAIAELRRALQLDAGLVQAQRALSRLEARTEAGPPATGGDSAELGRGRALARRFYRRELERIYEEFSEAFAARMSLEELIRLHATVDRQLGPETAVLQESVAPLGEGRLYVRRARFRKHSGEVEVLLQFEKDGSIDGIMFRPAEPQGP